MERSDAIQKLKALEGNDLVPLALTYGVTIWRQGRKNKGWAGHVIERYLGLPLNCAQSPNFGSWELKIVPLKRLANGEIVVKETMAITMIDPVNVAQRAGMGSSLDFCPEASGVSSRIVTSGKDVVSPRRPLLIGHPFDAPQPEDRLRGACCHRSFNNPHFGSLNFPYLPYRGG
jgi:DNA mismatch repair enzyme MutH